MRVLFVGNLREPSRSWQRFEALRRGGHQVQGISTVPITPGRPEGDPPGLVARLRRRSGLPSDTTHVNAALRHWIEQQAFDVLWVEKALTLRPSSLRFARRRQPALRLFSFSEDDMLARGNASPAYRRSLPLYDVVYTTKSFNADPHELPALGARRVVFVPKTYDALLHRPVGVSARVRAAYGGPVGFIGTYEAERARMIERLACEVAPVRVWGNGWSCLAGRHPELTIEGRGIYGEEFVQAVCASDIQLGFLRKASRDLHTDRSVEIPACGGFLLAERTREHRALFREDEEAVYFDSFDELAHKVLHYRQHGPERRAIARRARTRCLASGYSHGEALEHMLTGTASQGRCAA